MTKVQGFLPSTCGLHFNNSGWNSGTPHNFVDPLTGTEFSVPFTDAGNGLCGGMVFTVRDYFDARMFIPNDIANPTSGTLYTHIVKRLYDSFNLSSLFLSGVPLVIPGIPEMPWQYSVPGLQKYMHLMRPDLPDHETWFGEFNPLGHGRAWVMINEEWPKIKADLDNGILSPIAMIEIKSFGVWDLGQNHQVLAYGYELNGDDLSICIYDPNSPDVDTATIQLNIGDPYHTTPVMCSTAAGTVYCFFRVDYSFDFAPAIPAVPAEGSLIKSDNRPNVCIIQNGQRHWIATPVDFESNGFLWENIRTLPDVLINSIPKGLVIGTSFGDGTLLQGEGHSEVYVIKSGYKYWITSPQAFVDNGYRWEDIEPISQTVLDTIPQGANIDAVSSRCKEIKSQLSSLTIQLNYVKNQHAPAKPGIDDDFDYEAHLEQIQQLQSAIDALKAEATSIACSIV